jgi:tRNA(His) 5'-end guanylyltransferase
MSELSDRQKAYEIKYDLRICCYEYFLIRLDGKGFSKRIKKWHCDKPFDRWFYEAMCDATTALMKEIPDIKLAWTGSDEITILFQNKTGDGWYSNRINKLLSLTASIATAKFNSSLYKIHQEIPEKYDTFEYPAWFDSRIITPPDLAECLNNIVYRQQDCIRNSISIWFAKFYSHKQSMNLNGDEKIQKMINEQNFDWNINASNWTKFGTLFYYVKKEFINEDQISYIRNVLYTASNKYTGTLLLKYLNGEIDNE